jgi:hypothetical protein
MTESSQSLDSMSKMKPIFQELFAIFLWTYLCVKVFIFDFDVYFVESYLPIISWVVKYKFIVFLTLISVFWLTVGDKKFLKAVGFVLIYPLFLLLWRIPKLLWGNWFAMLATIGFGVTFLKSFKENLIKFTIVSMATTLIISVSNFYILLLASLILFMLLAWHYFRQFYFSFIPSQALFLPKQTAVQLLEKAKSNLRLTDELKTTAIEAYSKEQKDKRNLTLQTVLVLNRSARFFASKLKELQESRLVILFFLFALLFSFVFAVFSFALLNLALFKIDPFAFSTQNGHGFWFFLYYSLNTILTNGVVDFYPLSPSARLLNILEVSMGVFLIVILFFVYVNVKSDKTKSEVDDLVATMEKQGDELELVVAEDYSMDIETAVSEIEKLPGSLLKVFTFLTSPKKKGNNDDIPI